MPSFENPYINPETLEHHITQHAYGGYDAFTVGQFRTYLYNSLAWYLGGGEPLSIDCGGTGFNNNWTNSANIANVKSFFNQCFLYYLQSSEGGTPLRADWGGTGFDAGSLHVPAQASSMRSYYENVFNYYLLPDTGGTPLKADWGGTGFALRPDERNLSNLRNFFNQGLMYAFAPYEFYDGAPIATGIPVNCGGTGCTDDTGLTAWLSALLTPADIGACEDDDTRLTDARTPTAHATCHKTGGADVLTPGDIGAADAGHTHAGYLTASFDDVTNYLTIGAKTFDLTSLLVP